MMLQVAVMMIIIGIMGMIMNNNDHLSPWSLSWGLDDGDDDEDDENKIHKSFRHRSSFEKYPAI